MAVDSGGARKAGTGDATGRLAEAERTTRRLEAMRVHGACLHICGTYFYRHGDLFSSGAPSAASGAAGVGGAEGGASGPSATAAAAIAAAGPGQDAALRAAQPQGRRGPRRPSAAARGDAAAAASLLPGGGSGHPLLPRIATSYSAPHRVWAALAPLVARRLETRRCARLLHALL